MLDWPVMAGGDRLWCSRCDSSCDGLFYWGYMADKRYYWLKLHRDFFKRHDIKIIEAQENGKDYLLFYMKLLTESIDHDGRLRFSDTVPYDEKMLSIITGTNIDIVRSAVPAFVTMGLMEIWDDGTFYMTIVQQITGSETDGARRQRLSRERKELQCHNTSQICHTELEKEIDKEKEIDIGKAKSPKHKYGEYKHVLLTDAQHSALLSEWGHDLLSDMIRKLDEGIQNKGYKYKDHNLTLRNWHKKDSKVTENPKQIKSRQWQHRTCTACYRDLLDEETECPVCGGKDFC